MQSRTLISRYRYSFNCPVRGRAIATFSLSSAYQIVYTVDQLL